MRFISLFAAFAALAASAAAIPGGSSYGPCLSDADAAELVKAAQTIFGPGVTKGLILKYLTKDIHVYSDSINFITPNGPPLGQPVTTSRKQFIQQSKQPMSGFTVVDYFHSCTKIAFRWFAEASPNDLRGINVLETVYQGGRWRIKTDYSEFDNAAFLADQGGSS